MRAANAFRTMSPIMAIRVDGARRPVILSRPNPSLRSDVSASERVGHLVMQAMTYFESNPEAAWVCLRDAPTLLPGEIEESGIGVPLGQNTLRRGGLAVWQARRALEYIEANLVSRMAIRDVADSVALSKAHFSRAFKQSLGSSPIAYVMARRIERAKLMMTSTRETLASIAQQCGFADQSHFNRYFRRLVGMSPGLWRRLSILNPA
jgi:AraC-like DNA-binding protein